MTIRRGRCVNFGNCTQADSRVKVEVPEGSDFVCPECGRALQPMPSDRASMPKWLPAAGAVGVIALALIFFLYRRHNHNQREVVNVPPGLLGRPLVVGIVTWPGYSGGIVANNGFNPNKECIYWKDYNLLVEFKLMEDVDARAKAFSSGNGVDIVWSTVDFWANELPGFARGGVKAKAIMQVDWSRGGDAIVADQGIRRIEDLLNKKISLV